MPARRVRLFGLKQSVLGRAARGPCDTMVLFERLSIVKSYTAMAAVSPLRRADRVLSWMELRQTRQRETANPTRCDRPGA